MKRLQTKPSGAHITPTDWQTFLDEVVTPQFPAELTVFDFAQESVLKVTTRTRVAF